ncbi:MerC domain-containing protein [Alkalimonas sp. NCh-2]|uniref:MerC domain-containing protein n=1 Tax=Alkalimonas sp. NCh-2 TaxID=3144846 RepID=UPI0031F6FF6D
MLGLGRNVLDKAGIALTSLCAVHCIVLPVLLPVLPLLGASFLADESFERAVLLLTMVLGFIALFSGFHRYHRKLYPFYSLFLGGFIYWHKDIFGHHWEPAVLTIGAAFVVLAHVMNMRLCQRCSGCKTEVDCKDNEAVTQQS